MTTVVIRKQIIKKEALILIKVMDTNENEAHKDVVLVKNSVGRKLILRIGEVRAHNFWPRGYHGKDFVVPRIFKTAKLGKIIYEIEEYLPGRLLSDVLSRPRASKILPAGILKRLIQTHWEFQLRVPSSQLRVNWSSQNLEKFYQKARNFLTPELQKKIREIISGRRYAQYWSANYPAKWKFSVDNLILLPDGRIGFVDLARAGKRFWGYDLGWLFWPAWLHFRAKDFNNPVGHIRHLNQVFKLVYRLAPAREKKRKDFYKRCWLIIMERCLGALFDIVNRTSHIKKNLKGVKRQRQYRIFVLGLLSLVTERL